MISASEFFPIEKAGEYVVLVVMQQLHVIAVNPDKCSSELVMRGACIVREHDQYADCFLAAVNGVNDAILTSRICIAGDVCLQIYRSHHLWILLEGRMTSSLGSKAVNKLADVCTNGFRERPSLVISAAYK